MEIPKLATKKVDADPTPPAPAPGRGDVIDLLEKILKALTPSREKFTSVYYSGTLVNVPDVITTGPGVIHGYYFYNTTASARSVKVFDKASAPRMTGDRPRLNLILPANGAASLWAPRGIHFATGIGIAVTTGAGDYDNTAGSAGDVIANVFWESGA